MQKRILALDVGDARIGVALSDPLGMFASPLTTIENKQHSVMRELRELITANEIGTIVLGMPFELDGVIGEQGKKVEAFAERVRKSLAKDEAFQEIRLEFVDERYTSQQAEEILYGSRLKNKERRAANDRVAAALILESYLEQKRTALF